MKRRIFLLSFLVIFTAAIFVFWPGGKLKADDRSIFSASTKPNVMLLLDNSGSMSVSQGNDFVVLAADHLTFESYTLTTGKTYTFTTSGSPTTNGITSRIEALKRVTIQILDKFRDKVKMGFANYFYPSDVNYNNLVAGHWTGKKPNQVWVPTYLDPQTFSGSSYPCGAVVRSGVTDLSTSADPTVDALHDAQLEAICDAVKGFIANGNTPLAESLDTCYGYYAGTISATDGNTWTDYLGYERIPDGTVPPIQYTCQQNYVLMVTDGEPTHDEFGSGSVTNYTNVDGTHTHIPTYNYSHKYTTAVVDTATGGFTDVLNVAKWMFDHPFPGQINGGIRTWAVGMRLNAASETNLKLAVSTAYGHGTYLAGNDYASLNENLMNALESINLSSYAFSSYTSPKKLTTGTDDTYVSYSGYFLNKELATPIWEGHLKCLEIVPVGASYNFVERWDSSQKIFDQYSADVNSRVLSTQVANAYDSGLNKFTYTPLVFKSSTVNPNDWKKSLNVASDTEVATTINYIRGNATTRGVATTTSTLYLLADIFHSDVIYVGKPMPWKWIYNTSACDSTASSTDLDCFQNFYATNAGRQKTVYAGTNDGVVHAVKADKTGTGGQEISGFIPDEVLANLKNIALNKNYTYTADGRMTTADIYSPTNKWQTILAFGLREGGKFYYCRNVTSPGSQTSKWKFPDYVAAATITAINTTTKVVTLGTKTGTFAQNQILVNEKRLAKTTISAAPGTITVVSTANLAVGDRVYALPAYAKYVGETWGKPVIGRLKYKKSTTGSDTEAWVTILTGGFGEGASEEGKALFIVDADSGALIWYLAYASTSLADNYDCYIKNTAELNYPIPQSLTAVDLDNDTYIDTLYFGNTGGNLFKLNIANSLTSTWIPQLLFKGITGTQPIYLAPSISYDQCYKLWIHFGTGDRNITQTAPTGQFIGIMDSATITYPLTTTTASPVLQKLTWTSGSPDTMSSTPDKTMNGWYFDFLDDKETFFDPDPVVIPDKNIPYLYFNTYQPKSTVSGTDPCGSGGNMHVYSIRLPYCFSNGDLLISGEREEARIAGGGMVDDGYIQYKNTAVTGSITTKEFEKFTLQYPGGVFYFKEIVR